MRSLVVFGFICLFAPTDLLAGDMEAGTKVYNKCKACHAVGPNAKKKVGPPLNQVIGRSWGAIEGFKYSGGKEGTLLVIHEAEPRTWDVETLTAYLRKPKDVIPKGKMAFAGLKKDEDIENVIYYLASFDADGNPVDPEAVLVDLAAEGE
ncbi:MAG: c-type cytochrome [Hyphomicrobiales bacterium]|nr:c-type cytochrome [Hyphomicrobiales bacterium]